MSEFKGTKGKWSTSHGHNCIYIQSNQKKYVAKMESVNTNPSEHKANALLISKAPEMLGMLKDLELLYLDEFPIMAEKVRALIKEATEL